MEYILEKEKICKCSGQIIQKYKNIEEGKVKGKMENLIGEINNISKYENSTDLLNEKSINPIICKKVV
jgi:hypothetical protein